MRFSALSFFHESLSPGAPEYPTGTVSNFFKNSRRYSRLNVYPAVSNTPMHTKMPKYVYLLYDKCMAEISYIMDRRSVYRYCTIHLYNLTS